MKQILSRSCHGDIVKLMLHEFKTNFWEPREHTYIGYIAIASRRSAFIKVGTGELLVWQGDIWTDRHRWFPAWYCRLYYTHIKP